jgi:hypothetical protein
MSKSNFSTSTTIRFKNRESSMSIDNVVMDNYDLDEEVQYGEHASEKASRLHGASVFKYDKRQYFGTSKYHEKVNKEFDEATTKSGKVNNENAGTWYVPEYLRRVGEKDAKN